MSPALLKLAQSDLRGIASVCCSAVGQGREGRGEGIEGRTTFGEPHEVLPDIEGSEGGKDLGVEVGKMDLCRPAHCCQNAGEAVAAAELEDLWRGNGEGEVEEGR